MRNEEFMVGKKIIKKSFAKKKKIFVLGLIGVISIGIISVALLKEKEESVVAGEKINTENEVKEKDKKSIYLSLEDDEFADDAKIVEKNLKDLITGKRSFPVRDDGKKVAYLTFDDGPSTTVTPEILKILKEENVKGTFFVLGNKVTESEKSKSIIKEIAKGGHALANHTYTHDYKKLYPKKKINPEYFVSEVEKTNKALKDILGEEFNTRVVRFPGGYWSWNGREEARKKLDEKGICSVDWNALNGDAEGLEVPADKLNKRLKNSVNELGDKADNIVVLMHDTYGKETTAKTLKETIKFLRDKGFEFRTMK